MTTAPRGNNGQGDGPSALPENPFVPGLPAQPADFVDREREVDLIFGHIAAVQRGSVAVHGALGMGKTSLLRYIADPTVAAHHGAGPPELAIVYVDIQSVAPFDEGRFWHRVASLLLRAGDPKLAAPVNTLMAADEIDVVSLEAFLDSLSEAGRGLVLLLDEFEWAIRCDSREREDHTRNFLAQLASLVRRTPRVLSLVTATEEPIAAATRVLETWRGSPFATVFTAVGLKPLGPKAAREALRRGMDRTGRRLARADEDLLYEVSGGVPAALQAAAFCMFHGQSHGVDGPTLARQVAAAAREALSPASRPHRGEEGGGHAGDGLAGGEGVVLDRASGDVYVNGVRVEALTALEYNLLECLSSSPGRLRTKEEIVREVWGEELADDSRVEKLVSRLRRKIEPVPGRPQYIRTVRGRGYRLVAPG